MLKSLRTARYLAGLTLFSLFLSVAAPIALACDMGRMDDMRSAAEMHAHADRLAASVAGTASPVCKTTASSAAQENARKSCCDELTPADAPCRPTGVDAVPLLCACHDVEVRAPADRTREMTETSLALDVSGHAVPHPRGITGVAPTRVNAHASVPDRTILYGCFLI